MTAVTGHDNGLLREMTEDECWEHLSECVVGRIAYVDQDGPIVLPINYLAQDGRIWIRTASYNQMAIHVPGQQVAFEVDHVDGHRRTGWSVVVRGRAEHVTGEHPVARAETDDSAPWPDGTRTMMFCLTPREVTGRTLRQRDLTPAPGQGPGSIQRSTASSTT